MKNIIIALPFSLTLATAALADFPPVYIDPEAVINLDYGETIDMTGTVNVPSGLDLPDANINVNQFNHASPTTAVGSVINNVPSGVGDNTIDYINVNVTAVGNNAAIDISKNGTAPVVGAVQGNQDGSISTAAGTISGNRVDLIDGEIVELNVTAVGNNLSIENDSGTKTTLGSIQFNYDSGATATGSIINNGFGVNPPNMRPTPTPQVTRGRDPELNVTAVGNNLATVAPTVGSMTQINRGSPITATGTISGNIGAVGPVLLDVTAVGNNISIKPNE
jgi:hypothetical protein